MRVLWIASAVWVVICLWLGVSTIREGWSRDATLLEWGGKLETILAGVGAFTVGAVPPFLSWLLHRFHKSRERGRLLKEKARIEARLAKLDQQQQAKSSEPHGATSREATA